MSAHRLGCAALLAGLPGMGPRRLAALLHQREPAEAWALATSGREEAVRAALAGDETTTVELPRLWAGHRGARDPVAVAEAHAAAGVVIALPGDPGYLPCLVDDREPPPVLFRTGSSVVPPRPRVAIVGTRRCTGTGASVARELGRDLSASGVSVVSGLALGIDGAAHRGALDPGPEAAAPVGVVGSGLDVVYPHRHRSLWDAIRERGLLLSEAPLGARPLPWRFPARNRVIAALADIVVVVESHEAGGSLHTVDEAQHRDIPVMVVPGSVRSPATAGTHQLLAEGCHPVRDASDVLLALGLSGASRARSSDPRTPPTDAGRAVLEVLGWEPATLDHLVLRTGHTVPAVAAALDELQSTGWVVASGGWYEQVAAP